MKAFQAEFESMYQTIDPFASFERNDLGMYREQGVQNAYILFSKMNSRLYDAFYTLGGDIRGISLTNLMNEMFYI